MDTIRWIGGAIGFVLGLSILIAIGDPHVCKCSRDFAEIGFLGIAILVGFAWVGAHLPDIIANIYYWMKKHTIARWGCVLFIVIEFLGPIVVWVIFRSK